uniref:Uncharacterized protein n=1 Tax=Dunaliella tertiolecta TaxID=3047 RepID=A0A7S3R8U7_DUNTE|mmetsp:Transcript_26613/g.71974  ORF Transcript_26613/g.71974 Transcript_26613/m.71974 type:complete len:125 (-) Transcript_26613:401-775(-)
MRNSLLQSLAFAFAFLPGKVFARDGSNTMGAQEREHVSVGNNAAGSQFSVERHLGSVAHSIWDGAQHRKLLWGSGTVGRRGAWPQRETMDASHMSLFSFELLMLMLAGISLFIVFWRRMRVRHV